MTGFDEYFPVWKDLDEKERAVLLNAAVYRKVEKGAVLHSGSADCVGLFLVKTGVLRAYIVSEEGKEVSIYRLFERDMCLFSASCMMASIQFDIHIQAEKDTGLWIIPPDVYQKLMKKSIAVAHYTNELMASRFTDVMWIIEQVLFKSVDVRLANFILEESSIENSDTIAVTHEKIAQYIGTAREVVTRMLKYFQNEGLVSVSRQGIRLENRDALEKKASG